MGFLENHCICGY